MKKKKALILVQGITAKNYILNDLIDYLGLDYKQLTIDTQNCVTVFYSENYSNYDLIISVNTEKFLSKWSLFRLWDKLGDYILGNLGRVEKVREVILGIIADLSEDYIIDGLGHSYGGQTLAGVDYRFDQLVLCGAPITSRWWSVRTWTKKELSNNKKASARILHYIWNKFDQVCCKPFQREGFLNLEASKGHTFFNKKKKLEENYLFYADGILKIKK